MLVEVCEVCADPTKQVLKRFMITDSQGRSAEIVLCEDDAKPFERALEAARPAELPVPVRLTAVKSTPAKATGGRRRSLVPATEAEISSARKPRSKR